MSPDEDNTEDQIAQFWALASRFRAAMRDGCDAEMLIGLLFDIQDLELESPVALVRKGAGRILADFEKGIDAAATADMA